MFGQKACTTLCLKKIQAKRPFPPPKICRISFYKAIASRLKKSVKGLDSWIDLKTAPSFYDVTRGCLVSSRPILMFEVGPTWKGHPFVLSLQSTFAPSWHFLMLLLHVVDPRLQPHSIPSQGHFGLTSANSYGCWCYLQIIPRPTIHMDGKNLWCFLIYNFLFIFVWGRTHHGQRNTHHVCCCCVNFFLLIK